MTAEPIVAVTCSIACLCGARMQRCTDSFEIGLTKVDPVGIQRLTQQARDAGWRWRRRRWLCPTCVAMDPHDTPACIDQDDDTHPTTLP